VSPALNQDNYTDENGEWIFTNIAQDGLYNITVNYTQNGLSSPKTETVYYFENFPIATLSSYLNAYLSLTTLIFNVSDRDSAPIDFGYVLLKEGAETVGRAILSNDGTGTIIWINNTAYDYEVYYDYDSLPDTSNYRYSSLLIKSGSVGLVHDFNVLTEISKIVFNVTDDTPEKIPFTNAKLRFYNQTDYDNENLIIANVSVDINGLAKFVSFSDNFGDWGNYTVDIYFGGALRQFHAGIDPLESNYNFTLTTETEVSIRIPLNKNIYNSTIEIIDITSEVTWGDNVNVHFNFTKQDPSFPASTKVTPNDLFIQIYDEELTVFSQKVGILSSEIAEGVFNYTFSTETFHLIGGSVYYIEITGNYKSYVFNAKQPSQIKIASKTTGIKFYDYSLNELTNNRISTIYLEPVNITVDYYDSTTDLSLPGADLTYSWDYGAGVLSSDPLHAGKYYFEFDSSLAPSDADYIIDITAFLLNYSLIEETLLISILARPTSINGTTTLFQISPDIYVLDSAIYSFAYRDVLSDALIGDLNVASYNWYKLDEEGNPLSGPENEGTGNLIEEPSNIYTLDFDTELKEVGEYTIFITLQKNKYEVRNAFISLSIKYRPVDVALNATGLSVRRIDVVQGTNIDFQVTLTDPSNANQLLTNATVLLRIGLNNYTMNEITNGVYEFRYSTANIDAFMFPQTLDETSITIEKENYESQTIEITIVVGMTEIFPGFPMFYFLLLVIGIVAIVGSLVTYRQIQRARIPTFVKKAREMKSTIKSRKSISESLLYPSKESYIVKQLGDKWETLGLSLEEILGFDTKKKKKLPDSTESKGGAM
jgi:frataxin-like iron-binding protein CyaY